MVGWGVRGGAPAVRRNMRAIDGYWAGNRPEVLLDRRGPEVEALIDQVEAAILSYPYPDQYRTWPGPNSNTFIAHIARSVPALGLELPPTAIGKDYLSNGSILARTPSGTGLQLSLLGLLGLSLARDEGLEINLLGLTFGVDPLDFALKLPGIGRSRPALSGRRRTSSGSGSACPPSRREHGPGTLAPRSRSHGKWQPRREVARRRLTLGARKE